MSGAALQIRLAQFPQPGNYQRKHNTQDHDNDRELDEREALAIAHCELRIAE
jgi:hypothetical protein